MHTAGNSREIWDAGYSMNTVSWMSHGRQGMRTGCQWIRESNMAKERDRERKSCLEGLTWRCGYRKDGAHEEKGVGFWDIWRQCSCWLYNMAKTCLVINASSMSKNYCNYMSHFPGCTTKEQISAGRSNVSSWQGRICTCIGDTTSNRGGMYGEATIQLMQVNLVLVPSSSYSCAWKT